MIEFIKKLFKKSIETKYVFIYKKFPMRKQRKFNKDKVTGECYIESGEFGLLPNGVAVFSKDLHVDYFCKHQDKENNCTTHEQCDYRRGLND